MNNNSEMDTEGWEQFALNEVADADAEFFLQFAEDGDADEYEFDDFVPQAKQHIESVQAAKARIAAEQPIFLQEVARFNARPQQNFTAAPYPNGFALATH